eukprot:1330219-Pyramimonas_sp.AAC.2
MSMEEHLEAFAVRWPTFSNAYNTLSLWARFQAASSKNGYERSKGSWLKAPSPDRKLRGRQNPN